MNKLAVKNVSGIYCVENAIHIANKKNPMKIVAQGLLMPKDHISRNRVLYDWESVVKHHKSMIRKSFLYNHKNVEALKPIGHITDSEVLLSPPAADSKWEYAWNKTAEINGKPMPGWYYEVDINPTSEYADSILRGDIPNVSLQIMADESYEETGSDGSTYTRAFIGDTLEISGVPTGGFPQTTLEVVLAEAFKIQKESQTTANNSAVIVPKVPNENDTKSKEEVQEPEKKLEEESESTDALVDGMDDEEVSEVLEYISSLKLERLFRTVCSK